MMELENCQPKMQSTYYLKHGQTLENTKISDRSLALVLPKSAYNRFIDYTTENERLAAAAAEKAAKLAALKKASYEMTKSWDNTIENIKKRRKEELLGRRKREEEARIEFVKNMKAKNAADRAEVLREAKQLLLWKKPQCRLINSALITSETYRQLEAQTNFNKSIKNMEEGIDLEYVKMMKKDLEDFEREEKIRAEERKKKQRAYRAELKKQIAGVGSHSKRQELQELAMDREDLKNMTKELELIQKCEAEQIANKKKELHQMFLTAVEEKKLHEEQVKRTEEYQDRAIELVTRAKDRIKKMSKIKMKQAMDEKLQLSESLARRCAATMVSREAEEAESQKRAALEKEALEREKRELKEEEAKKLRSEMEKYREDLAAAKERRALEERDLLAWETLQRFKRDEYNKEVEQKAAKQRWKKKYETATFLRKQIAEREEELKREKILENEMKEVIDNTNKQVLMYGDQVLEECRELNAAHPNGPTRPLFPIIKAIETFKKENGLIQPSKKYEERESPKIRKRRKRTVCRSTVPPERIIYV